MRTIRIQKTRGGAGRLRRDEITEDDIGSAATAKWRRVLDDMVVALRQIDAVLQGQAVK